LEGGGGEGKSLLTREKPCFISKEKERGLLLKGKGFVFFRRLIWGKGREVANRGRGRGKNTRDMQVLREGKICSLGGWGRLGIGHPVGKKKKKIYKGVIRSRIRIRGGSTDLSKKKKGKGRRPKVTKEEGRG